MSSSRRYSARADHSPFHHDRRSWTDGGVHYTVETASYASPSFTFSTMGGTANSLFNAFAASHHQPSRHSHIGTNGLLGTAVGLLDNIFSSQPSRWSSSRHRHAHRQPQAHVIEEDSDGDEYIVEVDDYPDPARHEHRRSMFGRFKDKLHEKKSGERHSSTSPSGSRDPIPERQAQGSQRHDSRRGRPRQAPAAPHEPVLDERDIFEHAPKPRTTIHTDTLNITEALENAVEHHRREVRQCKKELERASRQPHTTTAYLQSLLNELKQQETALEKAVRSLQRARGTGHRGDPTDPVSGTQRSSLPRREVPREPAQSFPSDNFFTPGNRTSHPLFNEFYDMHGMHPFAQSLFGHFHPHFGRLHGQSPFDEQFTDFFDVPRANPADSRRARAGYSMPSSNPYQPAPQRVPSFTMAAPAPPQPPSTLLTPEEAQRLFVQYNQRWKALAHTDPNVPFPTRGLHAAALVGRETLWAPYLTAHPSTWSEETAMQANAQAFYLGVVGLRPRYSEMPATGRIEMGFDKQAASPEQIKDLIDLLKKEKMRWHSDRLGRRNNGNPGPNETLQRDEKARAVFHAACELMEAAQ